MTFAVNFLIRLAATLIPVKRWRKRARRRLINLAQMAQLRKRLPALRANYAARERLCRDKYASGRRLDAVFLVHDGSMFSAEPIYRIMKADPAFQTRLLAIPDPSRGDDFMRLRLEKTLAALRKIYPEAEPAFDPDGGTAVDLHGKADVVFTSNPYLDQTLPQYALDGLAEHTLPVLVPYYYAGLHAVEPRRMVFRPGYSIPWKLILPNDEVLKVWTAANPLLAAASEVGGYPKMDRLAAIRPAPSSRKTVIISPHHSIATEGDGAAQSNFLRLADFFLSLPKRYPSLNFVFRPHPFLFQRFKEKATAGWDAARAQAYLDAWRALPNACYQDGGDYFETFASSSALIHDCGSFLAEYFYTGNPQCYVLRSREKIATEFTSFGRRLADNISLAVTEAEILSFVEEVVVNGHDPQRDARARFAAETVCSFHPHAAEAVCALVKGALCVSFASDAQDGRISQACGD